MIYLIPAYTLFSLIVSIRQQKSLSLIWFLMMPLGFILALSGLLFYTEYISFANFIPNPILRGDTEYLWKLNYFLKLSIFGMFRLINLGIALYIVGAVGYPLSQHPRRSLRKKLMVAVFIPAVMIVAVDPGLIQSLFKPDYIFEGQQSFLKGVQILNRLLNYLLKTVLVFSLSLAVWIHLKTPKILRKRSQLMILTIAPIHLMVIVLFYWFPGHSVNIWRLSTLKMLSLPYTNFTATLIFILSFFSLGVLSYTTIVYHSIELNMRRHRTGFRARMKTAGSGMKIFTHSLKNQFIAVRLLAEQEKSYRGESEQLDNILSVCERSIRQLGSMPVLPDRISLNYERLPIGELRRALSAEFPEVEWDDQVPGALISVDPHYMTEIVRNLIINSREAAAERSAPLIAVRSRRQLNYLVITVEDNGCGIEKDDLKHVFEPFYSTKPSISNWGMGLAFCRQLIEAFGGEIDVESRPDDFTRFEIYLPEEHYGKK